MNRTLQTANKFLMPNYGELKLEIVSGKGAWVWTRNEKGKRKRCLDLLCGLGVTSLGHCHPAVVAAISKQAKEQMHVSNLYATGPMAELAEVLVKMTGVDKAQVFFCNSGTEANEAAGKLARLWAYEKFGSLKKKNKIVTLKDSFHGRTFLSISLTGQPKMQEKFGPVVQCIRKVPLNDIKMLRRAVVNDDVCAVIFETIQAEGGVNIMSQVFYNEIASLSQKFNFLRIVDEVQTGMGRTGKIFSYQNFHNNDQGAEIITLAKALGGGLPIGAVIAKGEVGDYLLPGSHAATFGGNPVICAAALAVLKMIRSEYLLQQVNLLSAFSFAYLKGLARKHREKIKEVRGRGLMIGVELHEPYKAADVVKAMYEKGVLVGTAGPRVVRFLPPFIVTEKELAKAFEKFEQIIKKF